MFIGNLDVLSGENIRKMFESHGSQVDVINKSLTGIEKRSCSQCNNSPMANNAGAKSLTSILCFLRASPSYDIFNSMELAIYGNYTLSHMIHSI